MAKIDTDFMIGFNNIVTQLKQKKDKVSPEEWNSMWNILASQVNQNAQFLNDLKKFIVGEGGGEIEVPSDYQSLFDVIQNISGFGFKSSQFIYISEEPPTDPNIIYWGKITNKGE